MTLEDAICILLAPTANLDIFVTDAAYVEAQRTVKAYAGEALDTFYCEPRHGGKSMSEIFSDFANPPRQAVLFDPPPGRDWAYEGIHRKPGLWRRFEDWLMERIA